MRTVKLSNNREVTLGVFHVARDIYTGEDFDYKELKNHVFLVPSTHVVMTDPSIGVVEDGQVHFEGRSVCQKGDNFCKLEGRRRAAINLLRVLRSEAKDRYTLEDREAIFFSICPEFVPVTRTY